MKQNSRQTVSVVIAAYNRPDYLREAIKSVVAQTYPIEQIVVIDDHSSIKLQDIVDEFPNENILYFKKEKNQGVSNSRNIGIQKATGEWIAFLDDDDLFLPDKIKQNINDTSNNNNCSAVLCSYNYLETGEKGQSLSSGEVQDVDLRKGNQFCGATGLFAKREYLLKELFDESLPLGEDWDLFIRLKKHGFVYFNSDALFLYRKGHDSITNKTKTLKIDQIEPRIRSAYKHREWLGETYFRRRIAYQILASILVKKNKLAWIKKSLELAGIKATFYVLFKRVRSKLMYEKEFKL